MRGVRYSSGKSRRLTVAHICIAEQCLCSQVASNSSDKPIRTSAAHHTTTMTTTTTKIDTVRHVPSSVDCHCILPPTKMTPSSYRKTARRCVSSSSRRRRRSSHRTCISATRRTRSTSIASELTAFSTLSTSPTMFQTGQYLQLAVSCIIIVGPHVTFDHIDK